MKIAGFFIAVTSLCATALPAQTNPPAATTNAVGAALIAATRSSPTNWLSRHEGFVAQAKKGNVNILFLGDSITDNWRSKGKNVWNKAYAPRQAANFGIGGDRTQHVLWRLEHGELDGIKPKVTVLMIGTNNSNSDPAEDIAEAIRLIIGDIHARIPSTKILLLAIFPRNRPNERPAQVEKIHKVNELIAKYDDGKTVKFLDINSKFLGPDGELHADIMPDFLHPNEKGYQIWADAMEPTLSEMLK
jgi:beta-glucosidase